MAKRKDGDGAVFADLDRLEVNADQLAELFGVQKNTVLHWAREAGMPRIGRGRYSLKDCVHWHNDKLRNAIEGGSDITEERRRLISAQRQRHEIEAARLRGELIDAEEVGTCLNELAVIFSTQLDGLGAKSAPALRNIADTAEIRRILLDETRSIRRTTSAAVQTFAATYAGLENSRAASR
jgi:DNA-binding transcriptional MerR regulator